jgi:hypothetical protein
MSEHDSPEPRYVSKQNRLLHLPEWQLKIIRRYPGIYMDPSPEMLGYYTDAPGRLPAAEDYCNLRHGFECDAGWAELLEDLSASGDALVKSLRSFGFQYDARISACICKEKYGALVWQGHDNLLPPFDGLWFAYASLIEERSKTRCERSGKLGQLRNIQGRVVTLSDEEYEKEMRRSKKKR